MSNGLQTATSCAQVVRKRTFSVQDRSETHLSGEDRNEVVKKFRDVLNPPQEFLELLNDAKKYEQEKKL
jgi:hypothetical protein